MELKSEEDLKFHSEKQSWIVNRGKKKTQKLSGSQNPYLPISNVFSSDKLCNAVWKSKKGFYDMSSDFHSENQKFLSRTAMLLSCASSDIWKLTDVDEELWIEQLFLPLEVIHWSCRYLEMFNVALNAF